MKKIILAITLAVFTVGAYAADSANSDKATCTGKAACADKEKSTASCCSASKSQCASSDVAAKKAASKKVVHSPKGEQNSKS